MLPTLGVSHSAAGLGQFDVKVEYEYYDIDEVDDAYALWLTGAWRF